MAKLRVPEKRRSSFKLIASISSEQLEELVNLLQVIPVTTSVYEIARQMAYSVKLMPTKDAVEIIDTVLSLFSSFAASTYTFSELIEQLAAASSSSGDGQPVLAPEDQDQFCKNITKLLSISSLQTGAVGLNIQTDRPRTLVATSVALEAEPIFSLSDRQILKGMIASFTLKLEYFEDSERKSFFVALDDDDLDRLIRRLQLAQQESKVFVETLDRIGVPIVKSTQP
ncbi:MAG TPA: hypothetical protein VF928_06810 [Usitatibacteraceae bacterium]